MAISDQIYVIFSAVVATLAKPFLQFIKI